MSDNDEGMYWTEGRWREWADYADDVRVRVKFVDGLINAESPEEVWSFEFGPENDWDREWLERNLAELATADMASCCGHGNYAMDTKISRTEWGASGAVYDITLAVSTGILSSAMWTAFLAIVDRATSRAVFNQVTTAEVVLEDSKRRVVNHLGAQVALDDLTIVSASEEANVWTVEVRVDRTGDVVTVTTASTPRGCPVSRVTKRQLGLADERANSS